MKEGAAMRTFNAHGLVIASLAVVTTVLMTTTLVLGVVGEAGATKWTGTIGAGLLAAWMVAINVRRRPRSGTVSPHL
jgi:hypothetical protein